MIRGSSAPTSSGPTTTPATGKIQEDTGMAGGVQSLLCLLWKLLKATQLGARKRSHLLNSSPSSHMLLFSAPWKLLSSLSMCSAQLAVPAQTTLKGLRPGYQPSLVAGSWEGQRMRQGHGGSRETAGPPPKVSRVAPSAPRKTQLLHSCMAASVCHRLPHVLSHTGSPRTQAPGGVLIHDKSEQDVLAFFNR